MADILSQEEVDLLLGAVAKGDVATEDGDIGRPVDDQQLSAYDFRRPDRISKDQLKGLQSHFEAFARELSIILPPFLRTVVRVELVSLEELTYDEFILSIARPTSLSVVKLTPLEGSCLFELSPSIVYPIVDRLLGGKGNALAEAREFTEIENKIIHRVVSMMLNSLRTAWSNVIDFRFAVVSQESDPLIVQIVAGSEMVILVGYEIHVGETVGSMNICIPLMAINPVLDKISKQTQYFRKLSPELAKVTQRAITNIVRQVTVPMDAVLGTVRLPVSDLTRLNVGDVIPLDSLAEEPIRVEVGGILRFRAKPGRRGGQTAIQITHLVRE